MDEDNTAEPVWMQGYAAAVLILTATDLY